MQNNDYSYCPYCGTKLLEDSRFCQNCGNELNKPIYEIAQDDQYGSDELELVNIHLSTGLRQGIVAAILGSIPLVSIAGIVLSNKASMSLKNAKTLAIQYKIECPNKQIPVRILSIYSMITSIFFTVYYSFIIFYIIFVLFALVF